MIGAKEMELGFAKFGHIGSSLLDKLLDERAERMDLEVISVGSGAKMDGDSMGKVIGELLEFDVDGYVVVSPDPSAPGVLDGVLELKESEGPVVVVSDFFGKDIVNDLKDHGFGFVFVYGDALIGARKEFLDPVEMGDFNSNVLKVLSCTGVFRKVVEEIDYFIDSIRKNSFYLPEEVIDPSEVVSEEFENPYARAKARASLEISQEVAEKNHEACFRMSEKEEYLPLVAASHEMMKKSADLAQEAREIEKSNDSVLRTPHDVDGSILSKRELNDELD